MSTHLAKLRVSSRHKSRSKGAQVQLCTTGNKEIPRREERGAGEEVLFAWGHAGLTAVPNQGSGQEVVKRTLRLRLEPTAKEQRWEQNAVQVLTADWVCAEESQQDLLMEDVRCRMELAQVRSLQSLGRDSDVPTLEI